MKSIFAIAVLGLVACGGGTAAPTDPPTHLPLDVTIWVVPDGVGVRSDRWSMQLDLDVNDSGAVGGTVSVIPDEYVCDSDTHCFVSGFNSAAASASGTLRNGALDVTVTVPAFRWTDQPVPFVATTIRLNLSGLDNALNLGAVFPGTAAISGTVNATIATAGSRSLR